MASEVTSGWLSSTFPAPQKHRFKNGDYARLIDGLGGARVKVVSSYDQALNLWQIELTDGDSVVVNGAALRAAAPEWKAGDVILVKHHGREPGYTYVRGTHRWLSEASRDKLDENINTWFYYGWVTPLLQSGGYKFDPNRL